MKLFKVRSVVFSDEKKVIDIYTIWKLEIYHTRGTYRIRIHRK